MTELRTYQTEAIAAIYDWFLDRSGDPPVVLPTGAGKSLTMAEFMRCTVGQWPDTRFLVVTHVKELIEQHYLALLQLWPEAPAGIYSAGLGKRQHQAQILFCGIQSVHRKAELLQRVDIMLVDEAHLIPRAADTMYGRFIKAVRDLNPWMKLVGLTATPFRLGEGYLHRGDGALFDGIAHETGIAQMIDQGYLVEPVPKKMKTGFDVSGVKKRGGDFVEADLAAAIDRDDITHAAVAETIEHGLDWGADTLYWLARVQRPVTGPEIAAWQDRLGLSLQTAADMLGMSRSSFAALKSRLDAIPRHRAVLIRALERDAILRAALYRPRQPGRPRRPT